MAGLANWSPIQVNLPPVLANREGSSLPDIDYYQALNTRPTREAMMQQELEEREHQQGLLRNMALYQREQNLANQLMLARVNAAQQGMPMSNMNTNNPNMTNTSNQVPDYVAYGLNNLKGFKYNQDLRMKPGYIDCSSLIGRSLQGAGYKVNPGMTTATMAKDLPAIGFNRMAFDPNNLQPGDILWRNGHAAFYLGNGKVFGGHVKTGASELPLYRKNGQQLFNFTHVFRKI